MSRSLKILIGVVVVAVAAAAGGVWWYLRDDAPAKVSLEQATKDAARKPAGPGAGRGVEGAWTVDNTTGDFDFESASGTFAGFRVQEELARIGHSTAVGRTGDVTGTLTIAGDRVTEASFAVDLTTITTNQSQRDRRVQDALDTDEHPEATFRLTEPIALPIGELTVHGQTRPVEVGIEARVVKGRIVLVGSVPIKFSDYGVEVPSSPIVLSVEDHGEMEFQILLVRG
ncbi:MAG: YceI family protein [Acidimicrobiia bacterium]|nr:YceI family protein [Acidimicrobiia bacterium]